MFDVTFLFLCIVCAAISTCYDDCMLKWSMQMCGITHATDKKHVNDFKNPTSSLCKCTHCIFWCHGAVVNEQPVMLQNNCICACQWATVFCRGDCNTMNEMMQSSTKCEQIWEMSFFCYHRRNHLVSPQTKQSRPKVCAQVHCSEH